MTEVAAADTPASSQRSRLSRKWTLKIGIIALGLIGFGIAGVYDALVGYPNRGKLAAENLEYQYLQQLDSEHQQSRANIPDPVARLAELEKKHDEGGPMPDSDKALIKWLEQLQMVHKLGTDATVIPRTDFRVDEQGNPVLVTDFNQRLAYLKKNWTTSAGTPKPVSPLSWADIPSQWVIVAVGLGFGFWLVFVLLSAKARVFAWDPSQERLTLPGGASIVPSDIAEFDKRKWHRLFITLKIKPSHPQLGGKDVTLDLLRHEPVEDWVLAMEKTAFPESVEKELEAPPPPSIAEAPASAEPGLES